MLDRLVKKGQESGIHPHEWRFREKPSNNFRSRSSTEAVTIPSPSIFKDVAIPYSMTPGCEAPPMIGAYPAPGHSAALLLLIECFEQLRCDMEQSLALRNKCPPNQDLWQFYISLAIKRFRVWITRIESIIRHSAVFNRYGTGSHLHGAFTENYVPPLDVLLVWYCYLQNPSAYERLLASNDFKLLAQISFPWHVVPQVIDQETLDFTFNTACETLWANYLEIPCRLEDCIGLDLEQPNLAFTSSDSDMLDMVIDTTETFRTIHRYHWLRSPALPGTLRRALQRYVDVAVLDLSPLDPTEQVPVHEEGGTRTIRDLNLDIGQQLILQTHRAYYRAWQAFSQIHKLADEERPPPPAYRRSVARSLTSMEDIRIITQPKVPLVDCYCWICERVKDELELEEPATLVQCTNLSRTLSPDTLDDKRSTFTASSSSSGEEEGRQLSRKQIKQIKRDVTLFKHLETKRDKAGRRRSLQ